MHTICKKYTVPFIHRVFLRDGNPSHIHGHFWTFEFEFAVTQLNVNGFVVDFNELTRLEELVLHLKGKLVLSAGDPSIERMAKFSDLCELVVVPDASSEGLSSYYCELANSLLASRTTACIRCTVREDDTNSATFMDKAELVRLLNP